MVGIFIRPIEMKGNISHTWDVSPKEAIAIQKDLQSNVQLESFDTPIHTIAGVDVSMNRFSNDLYAGIIVLSYPDLTPITHSVITEKTTFPYIPGLLSFREIPALMRCFEKLSVVPDVVMVDGQGIAHPRRLGIAAHLGVLLDMPTIGCAKSRLYGAGIEPTAPGEALPLIDPKTDETLGMMYKVKNRAKPIIISPGHRMTVADAARITTNCLRGYRLPEPTRLAHLLVNQFRKGEL
jgi:deoxyribonuclease V